MIIKKVAHRYALALFQEAKGSGNLNAVANDMQRIRKTVSGSLELQLFLKSQIISRDIKKKVLGELFDKELSDLSRQFLTLILEKRREGELPGIAEAIGLLYKKEKGLVDIEVLVTHLPDSKQSDVLKKQLEKKTGSKIELTFIEDSSLKGGMAIRINDTVIDGTIKHKLQQLEASFLQAGM